MGKARVLSCGIFYSHKWCSPFVAYYVLFIISFIFGLISVKCNFAFSNLTVFTELLSKTINKSFFLNFISFSVINIIIAALIILCGYFAFGTVLDYVLFASYAVGNGALFALVCRQCGGIGIAVNLTMFLIPSILSFILFTMLSTSSSYFSNGLAVAVFSNRSLIGINSRMKDMLLLFVFSIPCFAAVSALRALFIMIFSGVFFA